MEKKIYRAVIFLVVGGIILLFNIIGLFSKKEVSFVPIIENTFAVVTNYSTYGNHFNFEGKFEVEDDLEINLAIMDNDGGEILLPLFYDLEKKTFTTSKLINEGIDLETLEIGNYFLLFKTLKDEEEKYYSFKDESLDEGIDYYTLTKDGKNKNIMTKFSDLYFKLIVAEKKLPSGIYDFVVDPGHGGKDPGAINGDSFEKNHNLVLAFDLKEKLEDEGYKVYITRTGDYDPGDGDPYAAEGRVTRAIETKAKMLFSVHLNSSPWGLKERGFEVYLSQNMNFSLARLMRESIFNNTEAVVSNNIRYVVENSIYVRAFLNRELLEMEEDAIEAGYELYDIIDATPYYYILREPGASLTHAYVDGRNLKYGTNEYRDVNYGIESYILEFGYLTDDDDLKDIIDNTSGYTSAILKAIKSYFK